MNFEGVVITLLHESSFERFIASYVLFNSKLGGNFYYVLSGTDIRKNHFSHYDMVGVVAPPLESAFSDSKGRKKSPSKKAAMHSRRKP